MRPSCDPGGDDLDLRLQEHHKALFTRIVIPVILGTTLFLVFSHWRFDAKFYSGLAVVLFLDVFNLYFTIRNRSISTPWGTVESRSDDFDTFRWCFNLPLDVFIAWSLEVKASAAVAAWLVLTFGALNDVYKNRNKVITSGVALVCFVILVVFLYPTDTRTHIYLIACYCGIVFILWQLEVSLVKEMRQYFGERMQRERIESEADEMKRDAVLGNAVRSLTHELKNLTYIAQLTAGQLRDNPETDPEAVNRLDRSLELMTSVTGLVLDDLGGNRATIRFCTLAQLQQDIRLLLGGNTIDGRAQVRFDFPESGEGAGFVERRGSTYLIIHNIVKNGREAILERFGDRAGGDLRIATRVDPELIVISVCDNGNGMSEEQVRAVLDGDVSTSKLEGHGLGMRFAMRECKENGYQLEVESQPGQGSRFSLYLPRTDARRIDSPELGGLTESAAFPGSEG